MRFNKGSIPWNKGKKYSKEYVIEHNIGLNPNSRNGFEKHNNRNQEKRIKTNIERYGSINGFLKGRKQSVELIEKRIMPQKGQTRKKKERIIKNCSNCNKEMILIPYLSKTQRFCCRKCSNISNGKNLEYIKKQKLSKKIAMNRIETKNKIRIARERQIFPLKDTSIEIMFQQELKSRNINFEKHKMVLPEQYYRCDIFLEPNIVIECDGIYWHKYPYGTEKDKLRTQKMREKGYLVIRYWEHEIRNNVEGCVNEIEDILCMTNNKINYEVF